MGKAHLQSPDFSGNHKENSWCWPFLPFSVCHLCSLARAESTTSTFTPISVTTITHSRLLSGAFTITGISDGLRWLPGDCELQRESCSWTSVWKSFYGGGSCLYDVSKRQRGNWTVHVHEGAVKKIGGLPEAKQYIFIGSAVVLRKRMKFVDPSVCMCVDQLSLSKQVPHYIKQRSACLWCRDAVWTWF